MEDLKVKYLGKCLKVNDVYLETIYIIVERIYVHQTTVKETPSFRWGRN